MGPIGVFLRCTGRDDPAEALAAVRSIGLRTIQISKLDDRYYSRSGAAEFKSLMGSHGIRAASVVIVFDGESYQDVPSVMTTVGYRPAELLEERLDYSRKCVDFAQALGVGVVTVHMGFLPTDEADPAYARLLGAVGEVARYSNERGITLSLETGQETGDQLARFLDRIPEYPVGVNFDFANMVMYRMDDPTDALRRVLDRVTSVHVKDGLPPDSPDALGLETPPGTGKARVKECLEILHKADFQGPLIIENYSWLAGGDTHAAGLYEADAARVWTADPLESLTYAKEYVERCLTEIGAA